MIFWCSGSQRPMAHYEGFNMFSGSCIWFGGGSIYAQSNHVSRQCILNPTGVERDFKQGGKGAGHLAICCLSVHSLCDFWTEVKSGPHIKLNAV